MRSRLPYHGAALDSESGRCSPTWPQWPARVSTNVSTLMTRVFKIGIILVSFLLPSLTGAPSDGKETFAEIVEKFMVRRNGEVILDVRASSPERWERELLDRTAPWRSAGISPGVFRYVVIHEYNRYHSVQLDRDQKVLSFHTTHVEQEPLDASGPDWSRRSKRQ
jgi:hypothetical protein